MTLPVRRWPVLLALALLVGVARGQGTNGNGKKGRGPQWITLDQWGGEVGVVARYRLQHNLQRPSHDTADHTLLLLEERLRLSLRGSVYHPRFLTWYLSGGGSLLQGRLRATGIGSDTDERARWRYLARISLLPTHRYGLQLEAGRRDDEVLELHSGSLHSVEERYRAAARWSGPILLRGEGLWIDQRADGDTIHRDELRRRAWVTARREDPTLGRFELRYDYDDLEDRIRSTDYAQQRGTFHHRAQSADRVHALQTRLGALKRTGLSRYQILEASERYLFRPTRRWLLSLGGGWSQNERSGERITNTRGEAGVSYSLYRSLTLRVTGAAQDQQSRRGRERRYQPGAAISYRKRIPHGLLSLSYRGWVHEVDRNIDEQLLAVIDEPVVVQDAATTLLAREDVVPATVLVTDTTGATIYTAGVDYQLQTVGRRTELVRIATGAIADGQTVLVDYDYTVTGDVRFRNYAHDARASYFIGGFLRPFAELRLNRPERLGGTGRLPDRTTEQRYGVELRLERVRGRVLYEDVERTSGSYRSWGGDAAVDLVVSPSGRLTVGGSALRTDYRAGTTHRYRASLRGDLLPTPESRLTAEAAFERFHGRGDDVRWVVAAGKGTYRWGKIEASLQLRYRYDLVPSSARHEGVAVVALSRRF